MGCAIGMSVAAACELIYWLTLKPAAKLMVSYNLTLSTRAKYVHKLLFLIILFSLFAFCFYRFRYVYLTYITREW